MELLIVVGVLIALVIGYFCLGALLKFLVQWWMAVVFGIPLLYVGLGFGWIGAIGAVLGALLLMGATMNWQNSPTCEALEARLNKAFYFDDV